MVEGALDGESRAPGSSPGSDTDFFWQIQEGWGRASAVRPMWKVVSRPNWDGHWVPASCWVPRLWLPYQLSPTHPALYSFSFLMFI